MNWKWNSGAEHKLSVTPGKKWALEVRIPRKNMDKCAPDKLIFNVLRSRVVAENRSPFDTWSPRIKNSQDVENYGLLEFKAPAARSVLPGGDFTEPVYSKRFLGRHNPIQWVSGEVILKDTKIFRSGGASIRLTDASQGITFNDLRKIMKPDTRYRLTFYIKTQDVQSLATWGGGVYCVFDWGMKPRSTVTFPANNGKFTGTMPWTRQSFEFTTPKEFARDGRPYMAFSRHRKYNGKQGIAWIDQVELFELPKKK